MDDRRGRMRGDRDRLDTVEYSPGHAHVLPQCAQDSWRVPKDVDALRSGDREERQDRGGENERGAVNALVSTTIRELTQNPPDEFRTLATDPMSMSFCITCATYPSGEPEHEEAKGKRRVRGALYSSV